MFGEFDSESPRVPSPWDSLTPPSSPLKLSGIPKLVPEADEGNVEYKLQLLSPTPARFARLVTQLKWRLLEGGGQAYYEIGVADSGTLIGLPRDQLEQSLDTLEMMAGEIGASVIVVKEIEVSLELSSPAQSQIERWEERKRNSRRKDLRRVKREESPATSATELETELSNTDVTDIEETSSSSLTTPPASPGEPNFIQPFDSALAVFTMDAGEDVANHADNEATDDDARAEYASQFSTLEISSVYKPRPMKKRPMHIIPPQSTHQESPNGRFKNRHSPSKFVEDWAVFDSPESQSEPMGAKAQLRRDKRDKRRELKLSTQLPRIPILQSTESPANPTDSDSVSSCSKDKCSDLTLGPALIAAVGSPAGSEPGATIAISKEPRLIVEALVIRRLSLEEAFLDFEGFSLQ